jgi:RHS repeat-associated protein
MVRSKQITPEDNSRRDWDGAINSLKEYDAENRITGASQSIGSMYYLYDGAGRRVQEVSTYNVEKVFVYDVFGQMAAEYSRGAQSLPCTTCYIATDHLGSTRMVTDQNANVVGRHDYLPFGEEIAANTGGRNSLFGTQDFVNQKFTGQERDSETGLDFFQARYFSGALGRFNSPDPGNAGANLFNPQSWNAYTYAFNNPLTLIDPSGMSPFDGFNPSPDDPCAEDPFICGGSGFPDPDFPLPWPSEQPQPQPPPPPPPATPIVIPHSGGSYAQGQWGSFPDDGETLGLPAGMSIPSPLSAQVLLGLGDSWDCSSGLCVPGFGPLGADAVRQSFSLSPRTGKYSTYAGCLIGAMPKVVSASALPVAAAAAAGKTFSPAIPPPQGKLPPQTLVPGLKWGVRGQIVGAIVFLTTYEVELNAAAKSCSDSTGYTPWIFEP